MASVNKKAGVAAREDRELSAFEKLQRTIMACILFEDNYYEDGISVRDRIRQEMKKVSEEDARKLLYEAKVLNKLRSVSLFIVVCMAENKQLKADDVVMACDRVDNMSELLAIWNLDGKRPIPKQMKLGLQKCFTKFDEYQFGKYRLNNREWKTRDVLKLVRPKPENEAQSELWKKVVKDELATPDTWENELSNSKNKLESWTRLLTEDRLGTLAMLRNVRNMKESGVPRDLILNKLSEKNMTNVLPFQIMACARINYFAENVLNSKIIQSCNSIKKIAGKTLVMVDTSGSMRDSLSSKSEISRLDAAKTLAIILREACEDAYFFIFKEDASEIPARHGFALADVIGECGGGTAIYNSTCKALKSLKKNGITVDRIVIITDEQDNYWRNGFTDDMNALHSVFTKGYVLNIAPYQNGVGYQKGSKWIHVTGFSENSIRYISAMEA